jgi:hypothetical protein
LDFEIVNEIKRDPNTGKIRCVISEIKWLKQTKD